MPLRIRLILWRESYSRYWQNSGKPIPAIRQLAFRYQLFAAGAPWRKKKWISHIFCLKPLKTIFWNLKNEVPLNFQKKYPAAKHYTNIYRLVLLLTHLSFRWTVPLNCKYMKTMHRGEYYNYTQSWQLSEKSMEITVRGIWPNLSLVASDINQ